MTDTDSVTDEDGQLPRTTTLPLVSRSLEDFGAPGVWIEVDPETAEQMGAFEETAVSLADVQDAADGN